MGPSDKDIRFAAPFRTERAGVRSSVIVPPEAAADDGAGPSAVIGTKDTGMKSTASAVEWSTPTSASTQDRRGSKDRRKGRRRSRTIPMRQLTRDELLQGAELTDLIAYERPKTRQDCANGVRPCPFVSCRHHLFLEVNERTGSIKLNFPDIDIGDMKETCALDIADRGGATLEEIGEILNLTRERIRQLEAKGLEKLREAGFDVAFEGFFADKRE